MSCSTHIVECLRNTSIYPEVIDTLHLDSFKPEYGITYDTQNYFHSRADPYDTWTLDFKRTVFITGYQIRANQDNNWLRNWDFSIKKNGKWVLLESHQNNIPPGSGVHVLAKPQNTRFVKLKGGLTYSEKKFLAFYYIYFFGYSTKINLERGDLSCKTYQRSSLFRYSFYLMIIRS